MKIYVGGSLRELQNDKDLSLKFVELLGKRIVERGHTLLTGCRSSLDKAIASAANDWLESEGRSPQEIRSQIISYTLKNDAKAHNIGLIIVSKRENWSLTTPYLDPPEQIDEADVTIFIAGGEGTYFSANWARIGEKPILGIGRFGGAALGIYERELEDFTKNYSHLVSKDEFGLLNQYTDNVEELAEDVIDLCEKLISPNTAFIIMSFKKEYIDLYDAFEEVCKEFKYEAIRTDQKISFEKITPMILEGIKNSAFVIADITEKSLNVFYEIGYAEGIRRPLILTAKKGTELPFDIKDTPVIFWETHRELKADLKKVVEKIRKRSY